MIAARSPASSALSCRSSTSSVVDIFVLLPSPVSATPCHRRGYRAETDETSREYGMGSGKVFPAARAKSLLNPARRLVQSPSRTVAAIGLRHGARVLEL